MRHSDLTKTPLSPLTQMKRKESQDVQLVFIRPKARKNWGRREREWALRAKELTGLFIDSEQFNM